MPAIATFTDHGNGTGALSLAPGYTDAGVYSGVNITASAGTLSDSETFTITVSETNRLPVANAGADLNIAAGQAVQLDGSASFDPDGDQITYVWSIVSIPNGSQVTENSLIGKTTPKPTFNPDIVGKYVFRLVVNDGQADRSPG